MVRENNFVESYKSLQENKIRRQNERQKIIDEAVNRKEKFMNEYYSAIESREEKARQHGRLLESCRNNAFSTAIKAIFITALEAHTLTDNGIILAETMVDSWIKENGGANKILSECKNKSYLLSRISEIVEEAALLETEELENIEKDIEVEEVEEPAVEEDNSESQSEVELATKVIEKNLDAENDEEVKKALEVLRKKSEEKAEEKAEEPAEEEKAEDKAEDKAEGEEPAEEEKVEEPAAEEPAEEEKAEGEEPAEEEKVEEPAAEEPEKSEDPLNDNFDDVDDSEDSKDVEVPDDVTTDEDDNESDVAEDIVDDLEEVPEEDITVDGDSENNGKVFDELEKEEDVKKAVELIRQRVADAEETFIKRNAEDKKAIDELIGRISDNVKTVEDLNDEEDVKSKIAQESARLCKQKINQITENRPLSILEKMTRTLHSNIVKDQVVREQYLTEDGNMDTGLVVEAAKVMYGFLETLNTLQLEKVDSKYIEKILSDM